MRIRVLLLWLTLTLAVLANDRSLTGVGGTLVATQGEHPSVRMVSEQVKLEVGPRLVFGTAEFIFENQGPATKVLMGFPEGGHGDIDPHAYGNKSAFYSFASWVDGEKVSCKREIVQLRMDQIYEAHWVKEVAFAAGQRRTVRVAYVAPVGTVAGGMRDAEYHFTGGNWAGDVAQSKLEIRILPAGFKVVDSTSGLKSDGQRLNYARSDWEAEELVSVVYTPGKAGLLPDSMNTPLTDADLRGKSARELTLMRNEIFARYGRAFKDPQLKEYFESQNWYRVFDGYRDSMVSPVETANAQKIADYQNKKNLNW